MGVDPARGGAGLSAELARVDALLDDAAFFAPFAAHFDPVMGRPSIPIETYLRMMFLKFRYDLGYETLCREVADSISWQRFCRIPFGGRVPDPSTLMKVTTRCGAETVEQLNETLLAKAVQRKVVRTHRVRADTTVVEADVEYPTPPGLLAKAVGRIARQAKQVQAADGATRITVRNPVALGFPQGPLDRGQPQRRSGEAKQQVRQTTGELGDLAETASAEAAAVVRNARRVLARAGEAASGQLERWPIWKPLLSVPPRSSARRACLTIPRKDKPSQACRAHEHPDRSAAWSKSEPSLTDRSRHQDPGDCAEPHSPSLQARSPSSAKHRGGGCALVGKDVVV